MQLRVHGIGGTSPNAVLGAPADARLVPRWPTPADRRAMAWYGDDPEVCVYHWANLTSGSRWYVVWPLLLPFTLLNVAGYMLPKGRPGRVLQGVHLVLCLVATVWFAGWFVLGGQVLAGAFAWKSWIGLAVSGAVALAIVVPTCLEPTWRRDGQRPPIAPGRRRDLTHPDFFRRSATEWLLYGVHLTAAVTTMAGIAVGGARGQGDRHHAVATDVVVSAGLVVAVLLVVLLVGASIEAASRLRSAPRQAAWSFRAAGTVVVATALIDGLMVALLRVVIPDDEVLAGGPYATFDVYGWSVLATIAVFTGGAIGVLGRKAPGERVAGLASRLLPNPMSWFRARVAVLPRVAAIALGASAVAFLVVSVLVYPTRAPLPAWFPGSWGVGGTPSEPAEVWRLGGGAPTVIAQTTIYGLFSLMALHLWRSWGSRTKLRAVGSVWDVLAFWPRRFHPFAVRPYSGYAVNQLRDAMFHRPDDRWSEPLTVFAHSQGTVIAVAALAAGVPPHPGPTSEGAGTAPDVREATAPAPAGVTMLVTAGSPVRSLYMNAFPRYVTDDLVAEVARVLGPDSTWINMFRFTDHIGRTVFRDEADFAPDPGDCDQGHWCQAAPPTLAEGEATMRDCALADPSATQRSVQGHNDYFTDARVLEVLP